MNNYQEVSVNVFFMSFLTRIEEKLAGYVEFHVRV